MKIPASLLVLAAIAAATTAHAARVVGVNFHNGAPEAAQAAFSSQGAVWTDATGPAGTSVANGATFSVQWASSVVLTAGSWNDGDGVASQAVDREISLYHAHLGDGDTPASGVPANLGLPGDGIGVAIHLTGLSAWLAAEGADGYRLTVFMSTGSDPATFATLSLLDGPAITSPVIDTATPVRMGDGAYPSPVGNNLVGSRGFVQFGGFFQRDIVTLRVPIRSGSVHGSVAAILVTAVNKSISVVNAGGGSGTVNGGGTLHHSIGQGHPVGALVVASGQVLPGFHNLYVQHSATDSDGDLVVDENDADDDNDGLGDWVELGGASFNPVTSSDPLAADSDNDGASDRSEAMAGTNPQDANMRLRIVSVAEAPGLNQAALMIEGRAGVPLLLQAGGSVAGLADVGSINLTGGTAPWFFTSTSVQENHGSVSHRLYRLRVGP